MLVTNWLLLLYYFQVLLLYVDTIHTGWTQERRSFLPKVRRQA